MKSCILRKNIQKLAFNGDRNGRKVDFWNKNEGRWREFFFFIFFSKRKTTARLLNRSWSFDLWSLDRPQLSSTSHHRDGEGLKTRKHIIIIIMTIARTHSTKLPELVKKSSSKWLKSPGWWWNDSCWDKILKHRISESLKEYKFNLSVSLWNTKHWEQHQN